MNQRHSAYTLHHAKYSRRLIANSYSHRIWSGDEPQPERTFPRHFPGKIRPSGSGIEGITIDTMYGTDCHGHGYEAYIHFTIAYTNGTLAHDPIGRPGLFSITTPWWISYPKALRKAIFNDPISYRSEQKSEDCKYGRCFSEVIPGLLYNNEPVRLKRVTNPKTLRSSKTFNSDQEYFAHGECHYDDSLRSIWKMSVYLGNIGYYIHGANIRPAIIEYVEDKVRTTYPTLEIFLIVWATVGAIPTLIVVIFLMFMMMALACWLDINVPNFWASAQRGHVAMWEAIVLAHGKGWDAVKGRWKRGFRRDRNADGPPKDVQPATDEQLPAYAFHEWQPSRPPSYRSYDGACEGFYTV